jgi:hypothetical protein
MDDPRAQRTLVKSPPELWAEISDAGALAGHLGEFGEIRITRLEPETTVAWEGDRARGTVELEPAGWGTRVTLTACIAAEAAAEPEVEAPPEAAAEPEPEAVAAPGPATAAAPEPEAARRRRRWWPFARRRADASPPASEGPTPGEPAPDEPAAEEPVRDEPARATHEPPAGTAPERTPASLDARRAEEILSGVLDDLGAARHRPFSRG